MGRGLKALILSAGLATVLFTGPVVFAQEQSSTVASGLKLTSDKPIQIDADRLEVDQVKAMATFTGNVSVVQGDTNLKAARMIVYYKQADQKAGDAGSIPSAGGTDIDRMEVDGKVSLKSGKQTATGDKGTFDVKSNVLTLTGKEVVLSDGPTTLVGCRLIVDMTTNKSNLDGDGGKCRVTMRREGTSSQ